MAIQSHVVLSISTVPTRYLQFFEDIEGANTYAWGAAALAFLYRSLEKACTFKRRHFSGSVTLMQCWSYEHIMHMRPISHSIPRNIPRAKRWEPPKKYHGNPHNLMPPIRQEIDNLQPNELIWNPYFNHDEVISNDRQHAFQTALIFDDIAEPYMLDQVSVVQASTLMLVEALTLRQKWYLEVLNRAYNAFEMLSKFVLVDMGDVEARMEHLQCQYNDEVVPDEARDDGVGQSSRAVEDLAPSGQPAVEEPRRYNT
ncbi:hypothetical protein AMTR_s00045p00056700 [Amborella trichopoda]|uniref:Aminotransferase-like plant mobile domain-containing protein n=1 Tax=Amborella trichopoda TaxID=13333 RepID=W1P2S6_AMBTC|nr:hypothetical protein AMTR_s00045p00056700 [Amborella trichopoda]